MSAENFLREYPYALGLRTLATHPNARSGLTNFRTTTQTQTYDDVQNDFLVALGAAIQLRQWS